MLTEWQVFFRLIAAALLSGVIGFEREFHGRAAGFRTHILVCVGSTLIMLTSMHIFDIYYGKVSCDPGRIAAGVVTGIGFLGAGTIMRFKASIRGLTTAASLWVVSGLGLAVGSGLYLGAVTTAAITLVALFLFSRFEHSLIRKDWYKTLVVESVSGVDQFHRIREAIGNYDAEIKDFEVERGANMTDVTVRLSLRLADSRHLDHILSDINRIDGIKNVRWEVM